MGESVIRVIGGRPLRIFGANILDKVNGRHYSVLLRVAERSLRHKPFKCAVILCRKRFQDHVASCQEGGNRWNSQCVHNNRCSQLGNLRKARKVALGVEFTLGTCMRAPQQLFKDTVERYKPHTHNFLDHAHRCIWKTKDE